MDLPKKIQFFLLFQHIYQNMLKHKHCLVQFLYIHNKNNNLKKNNNIPKAKSIAPITLFFIDVIITPTTPNIIPNVMNIIVCIIVRKPPFASYSFSIVT